MAGTEVERTDRCNRAIMKDEKEIETTTAIIKLIHEYKDAEARVAALEKIVKIKGRSWFYAGQHRNQGARGKTGTLLD